MYGVNDTRPHSVSSSPIRCRRSPDVGRLQLSHSLHVSALPLLLNVLHPHGALCNLLHETLWAISDPTLGRWLMRTNVALFVMVSTYGERAHACPTPGFFISFFFKKNLSFSNNKIKLPALLSASRSLPRLAT